jgi:hypothetical protein
MDTKTITDATILDCGHVPSNHDSCTTGYGVDRNGRTACYACCALNDKQSMRDTGRAVLYLVNDDSEVTNWPGSLRLHVYHARKGRHNIAGSRTDVWFQFEGSEWHGTQYGEWSELCHCKKSVS